MLLQLKPLFMGEKESLPLHCELDLSELVIGGSHPFPHPVVVEGEVRRRRQSAGKGALSLRGSV